MKKIITIFILLTLITICSSAQELLRVPYPMTMRQRGMADAFTAVADDFYLTFTNPAGLAEKKNFEVEEDGGIVQIPPLNVGVGVQTDVATNAMEIQKLYNELGQSGAEQISTAITTLGLINRSNIGATVEELVLPFGYVGNNFGFNAFPTSVDVNISPVISLQPAVYLNVAAYSQLIFGFSPLHFDLAGEDNFHIGFAVKAMGVGLFEASAGLGEAITWAEDTSKALDFVGQNMAAGPGLGLNVGALWKLDNGLSFGLSVLDAPSLFLLADIKPGGSVAFDQLRFGYPNLKAGIAYNLDLRRFAPEFPDWLLNNIVFAFDMSNIVDPRYALWTKTHLGMSFNLFHTKWFGWNFSGGLNKGYLTFSTTVKLLIFRLSYAFYQDEAGISAGDFPVGYHSVSLNMRW